MRGPARVAGLSELQRSLENGFDIFRAMKGAEEFIALIASRERAFAAELFAASTRGFAGDSSMDRRWRACRRRKRNSSDRVRPQLRSARPSTGELVRVAQLPERSCERVNAPLHTQDNACRHLRRTSR